VWSCGVNDNAALGRITTDVPDPSEEGSFLDIDELTSWPRPVQALVHEDFRTVRIAAGDNIGAAISDKGEFRVWGTFRVTFLFIRLQGPTNHHIGSRGCAWLLERES
jgi:regulator of chromosome condensation